MPTSWNSDESDGALSIGAILAGSDTAEIIELDNAFERGVFGFDSRDRRSRPFNLLRSQVLKIAKSRNWKVIGVTSATPSVGKTFVASNLSASLSRIPGQHTFLFDLDLRRGSVAKQFGLPESPGIEQFLSGRVPSLGSVARNIQNSGLTIFPSTPSSASSAELLAGRRMKMLVQAMRELDERYICICDLPPAFANDDAALVLQQIDGYLLVVEEGRTTARQVRDAIEVLSPAPCLGTVLNRYRSSIGADDYGFGYHSNSYSAYYSDDPVESAVPAMPSSAT